MAKPKDGPRSPARLKSRTASSGSFHAGAPFPSLAPLRRQSTYRYQTFPTPPPKTPLEQPERLTDGSRQFPSAIDDSSSGLSFSSGSNPEETPLPVRQLLLLAFLSLSEQTALNSIGPYLPEMVASMPGIPDGQSGLYVGIIASAFALAQLSTNFLWGYASDVVGRKPVLLAGTFSLMCCFGVFGFCREYRHIVVVHAAMGMLNGNAACVPTVLGEVTDRSNQSKAFTYLPIIYSLGSITGPALGGILVGRMGSRFPYLPPNLLGAAMLATSVVVVAIWFEETLDESEGGIWKPAWIDRWSGKVARVFGRGSRRRQSWSSRWPRSQAAGQRQSLLQSDAASSVSSADDDEDSPIGDDMHHQLKPDEESASRPVWREIMNRTTIMLLTTYLIFQLSNISFNSLYPIFASAPSPTGRDLGPGKIGVSLSLAGLVTIIFQAFLFGPLKARLGSLGTYRFALLGIAISMIIMPWVGYIDDKPLFGIGSGKLWLYTELGVVLIIKNVCAVGGLSSVMLLVRLHSQNSYSIKPC